MEQLKDFIIPWKEKKVGKLIKSLYSLKQAPKTCHEMFDNAMLTNRFKINECNNMSTQKRQKIAMLFCVFMWMICSLLVAMIKWSNQPRVCWILYLIWKIWTSWCDFRNKIIRKTYGFILSLSIVDKILEKINKNDSCYVRTPFPSKMLEYH